MIVATLPIGGNHASNTLLTVLILAAELLVFTLVVLRKIWRWFPVFTSYIAWSFHIDTLSLFMARSSVSVYMRFYCLYLSSHRVLACA